MKIVSIFFGLGCLWLAVHDYNLGHFHRGLSQGGGLIYSSSHPVKFWIMEFIRVGLGIFFVWYGIFGKDTDDKEQKQ